MGEVKEGQPAIWLKRASAEAANSRVSSAAGISRPSRRACPAQRLVKSTLPSFSAAAFNGPSAVAAWGNAGASGAIGPTSRITRFGTPRAGRPVMTLVMTVASSRASASAAAGRDDRHFYGVDHLRHESKRAGLFGDIVGQEHAAMAARLRALRD